MATVTNEAVAAYLPTIERLAVRFNKRDYRIEFDDLVQEAWEKTWMALERGIAPTKTLMLNAMKNWADHVTHGVPIEPAGLNVQEAVSR
jgi:DNA-directed RNA polymerase specialized sigma24 family protein